MSERGGRCTCGHIDVVHPFGFSGHLRADGRCQLCDCGEFRAEPAPPAPPAAPLVPRTAYWYVNELARAESELEDKTAHVERLCADLRELQAENQRLREELITELRAAMSEKGSK